MQKPHCIRLSLRNFRGLVLTGILASLLTACAPPLAKVEPEGRLDVLGPFPGFAEKDLPDDWVFAGPSKSRTYLTSIVLEGVPALRIENDPDGYSAVLRTQAMMLATPFLSWAWNMETVEGGDHPTRLVVGFLDEDPEATTWQSRTLGWLGQDLPPHKRAISIAWGESALERGNFTIPATVGDNLAAPRYVARGGRENTGQWWLETIDLAELYARAWPGEKMSHIRISFIGIATEPGREATLAHISGVRLDR